MYVKSMKSYGSLVGTYFRVGGPTNIDDHLLEKVRVMIPCSAYVTA